MPDEKKPIDEIREKLAKGQEKLSQDETSALVDQYMIDSLEAPAKPIMLYFGPLGDLGHYFYSEEGGRIYDYPHPDVPWKQVDGALCQNCHPEKPWDRTGPEVVG